MKIFRLDARYEVVCEWKKTRNAFKHVATLLDNGSQADETKICYSNRTWECYKFESVIEKLLERTFKDEVRKQLNGLKYINNLIEQL